MPASITPSETARPATVDLRPGAAPTPAAPVTPPAPARPAPIERRGPTVGDRVRRTGDILVSLIALTVLSPLMLLIALGVRLSSPGPIFYQQVRVGQDRRRGPRRASMQQAGDDRRERRDRRTERGHGRPFRIYKFRTMVQNAEEYGPQWSQKGDRRIYPFGRFLRMTRLDETPQFLNVLRGDMSLIGPRPERPYFVEQFAETIPSYADRLRVRPGITGRAQVLLDYDSSVDDVKRKLEQDLLYIEKRSLFRDLGILCRTVWVVLTGKGAA